MSDAPVALVTGASRGLGYAVGRALGARGFRVVAVARTVGGLEELADAIEAEGGPSPTLVPLSLTDFQGLARLCLAVHERWGHLDLAVHCAANAPPLAPAPFIADKDFDQSIEVNLRATERLVTMLTPLLRAAPAGHFIHVTDDRAGQPNHGAYGAAKAAAEALLRSFAAESARIGPKVSIFLPRPMPTALRARFFPGENPAGLAPCAEEAARLLELVDVPAPVASA
ncbi:SDR family NAD(P)-dependent oxidoreductase [Amaricoccus solimangrovi]|uniref:SDR family NAD(P)-dependent oxidoreductase n=1 Tax=Amaricoccus solimangrovi TaxID=2589815 RepID=A0A501WPH5_9RHOB|nr:SDR family NAD(P)-dependent oxidoreductase [Amaricoccus solimangrovi]TPE50752.1 SDR family NAD(P)-dependent oxidoreductase [Amaricoccus solimangrovi]